MSCYIVPNQNIEAMATYIVSKARDLGFLDLKEINLREIESKEMHVAIHQLSMKLYVMNVLAYGARYEGRHSDNLAPDSAFRSRYEDRIQVYKWMRSYIYQCSEGDVFESNLFKDVTAIMNYLAGEIISDLPEYEEAEW